MTLTRKRHTTLQEHPPAEQEQKNDRTPYNPPKPNPDLHEMAPVAVHDDMQSEQIPVHILGAETHVTVEPEQKIDRTPENPLEGEADPDLHEISPVAVHKDINLEEIPLHLLALNAIKKGAPIARGGMSTVFNGKYGPIPVALKQATHVVSTLVNEAAIITKMNHPNVIHTYGIWKNAKQEVFMVNVTL